MFNVDSFNKLEPLKIYLCKPDKEIVCVLNGISENTAKLEYESKIW